MTDFKRKLASVMLIDEITPIPNADALELARLDGWVAVIRKDEFRVGEKVVYVETDSLLPEKREFEFMRQRRFRVKQIRLRGQISNGLVFNFSDLVSFNLNPDRFNVGDDLTDKLGIEHYQKKAEQPVKNPSIRNRGFKGIFYSYAIKAIEALIGPINAMASWPGYCPRSDEPQIRHLYNEIKHNYLGIPCVVHEKMHGKSLTAYYYNGKTGICSRNFELLSESTRKTTPFKKAIANKLASALGIKVINQDLEDYWVYAKQVKLLDKLSDFCKLTGQNLAIQLELCGPGISGNMYKFPEYRGFLFNIWDTDCKRYWHTTEVDGFCKHTGIERVPFLYGMVLHDDLQKYVDACTTKSTLADCVMEGHVIRPIAEINSPHFGRLSFKVINPQYKDKEDKLLGLED